MKKFLSLLFSLAVICALLTVVSFADDYYVYDAFELSEVASAASPFVLNDELINENDTLYVRLNTVKDGTGVDGTSFEFKIADYAKEFYIVNYPVMKIGYKTKVAASGALFDINVGLDYNGSASRVWGLSFNYDKTASDASQIINIKKNASGGDMGNGYTWSNVDSDSYVNYVRMKPYYSGQTYVSGEYIDIEYIAFFKDEETAENFDFDFDFNVSYTDVYLNEQVRRLVAGESTNMNITYKPYFLTAPEVTYESADTGIATVDANGKVTAVSTGTTTITATFGDFISTCKIIVLAEAIKPIKIISQDVLIETDDVIVSSLGDSITTYAPSPEYGNNYHDWWAKWYYLTNEDKGISGTKMGTAVGDTDTAFVNRYQTMRDDADLVTVKGGTNDFGGTSQGTLGDRVTTTYRGALRVLMEGLIEKYPDRQIVFFTPIKRCESGQTPETKNNFGDTLSDYAEAVKEIGALYGIPVIDLYNPEELDFTSAVITPPGKDENGVWHDAVCESELMPDGLHPSGSGQKIMAEFMMNAMSDLGIVELQTESESIDIDIDTIDYKKFTASELVTSLTYNKCSVASETVKETINGINKEFVRITAGDYTVSADGTQVIFALDDIGANFLIKEYPYMVVGYRTNIEPGAAVFDFNAVLKRDGTYSRHWGIKYDPTRDGTLQYLYLPLHEEITGGQVTDPAYTDFDDIDNDSLITDLYLKPWGGNSGAAMTSTDYADIEQVAFFKSFNDMAAYIQYCKNLLTEEKAVPGDVDGNGAVEANDSVVLSRYLAGWSGYADLAVLANANVDSADGADANDSVILSRFLAGLTGYGTLPLTD